MGSILAVASSGFAATVGKAAVAASHAPPRLSAAAVVPEQREAAASLTERTVVAGDSWLTPS